VVWYHNKSMFYWNDQCNLGWHHTNKTPELKPKGKGTSIMVADFMLAKYGFLTLKDGEELVHVIFKAGKNCNSWFSNEEIISHVSHAMDILEWDYADEDHIFIFDNTTTHLKHADNALAACKMPKWANKSFRICCTMCDENSTVVKGPDGKAEIKRKRAECKGFKCPNVLDSTDPTCCCRRIVYTQPDFVSAESLMAKTCCAQGFDVIFLLKLHCKLNLIVQGWGYTKDKYCRLDQPTSKEEMEENIIHILTEIPLHVIQR
jgi:hypothetical protein